MTNQKFHLFLWATILHFAFCTNLSFANAGFADPDSLIAKLEVAQDRSLYDARTGLKTLLAQTDNPAEQIEILKTLMVYDAAADQINDLDLHVELLRGLASQTDDPSVSIIAEIYEIYSAQYKLVPNENISAKLNSLNDRIAHLNDPNISILNHTNRSIMFAYNNNFVSALNEINRALAIDGSGTFGDVLELNTYWALGYIYTEQLNEAEAVSFYTKAIDFAVEKDLPVDRRITSYNIGVLYSSIGSPENAKRFYDFYQSVASASSNQADLDDMYYSLAQIESWLGNFEQSQNYIDLLGNRLPEFSWHSINLKQAEALNLASMGEIEKAEENIEVVKNYFRQNPNRSEVILSRLLRRAEVEILIQKGEVRAAFDLINNFEDEWIRTMSQNISADLSERINQIDDGLVIREMRLAAANAETERRGIMVRAAVVIIAILLIGAILLLRTMNKLKVANQIVEKESKHKSEFLANISHELRTPLNAIIGYSDLMMIKDLKPLSSEKMREYLEDINASGHHLLELINDILDLSKLDAGKMFVKEAPIAIADLISEVQALTWPLTSKRKQCFEVDIATDIPELLADFIMLKQIVINLVTNASKYSPQQSEIKFFCRLISGNRIQIEVKDHGIGMSDAEIEKATQPFIQIESNYVRSESGTGLGIPIVMELVKLHQAEISINSTLGQGTSVIITFPANRTII